MSDKLPFHRRITVRLIALFGSLVLGGALVGAYTSIQLARDEFFNVMERQFDSTFSFAENSLDIIGQMARTWSFHFAEYAGLSQSMRRSRAEISKEVERMRNDAHSDTMIVLDQRGRIIHHSAFHEKDGESLMSWQIVRRAVTEGKPSYGIVEESGNFIIYGSGITLANRHGAPAYIVLTGYRISDELVRSLSQDSAIGLTFVRRTAVMASSFSTPERRLVDSPVPFLDYQLLYNEPSLTREVQIDGQGYFASVRTLRLLDQGMDGSLLLTYPSSTLSAIIERLQQKYLWLYAFGLVVFSLFIWRISARIMAPLNLLIERTRRIAKGEQVPATIEKHDEIAIIASTINDLLHELATSKHNIEQHAQELEKVVDQRTHELRLANEELTRQATHDPLTGLPNRKLFNDRLHQAVMLAHRGKIGMALMFVDLDRFKWANDTFGHAVGDALLKEVSRRIQGLLREGDTIARLGGDEFTVILPNTVTPDDIENVARRILAELSTPFCLDGAPSPVEISGSIGIARFPEDGDNPQSLLQHADEAMYRAKQAGRATYRF
ncbi:MAG: diguanylate cyclase [Nitrosomonadales bacterium]|nr:diguanylate cyclase [Nitrosomonadales bacterium]